MPQSVPQSAVPVEPEVVARVRRFNRFHSRLVGALDEGHLHSPFSLTEVRVLYELAHRTRPSATEIGRDLRLDGGYLSRLLRGLEKQGLIERRPSAADGRQSDLLLTPIGRNTVADLEARASRDVAALVAPLPDAIRDSLVDAMATIERILGGETAAPPAEPYTVRTHRPGDLGWIVSRHAALYAQEYQWDGTFEAMVARIVADFIDHYEPERERCWIAERNGVNVGCVALVKHPDRPGVAKLRILLVEPSARGFGIGARLVDECSAFARAVGYHTIALWTNDILHGARKIYVSRGYTLVSEEAHHSFGHDLVGQHWELTL